jgi:NlpC/P60 family
VASKTGAYVLVVGGVVVAYSAITKRSVIDTILMRPSPGNITSPASGSQNQATGMPGNVQVDPNTQVGGIRQAILDAAVQSINEPRGTYYYDEVRPYPGSLYGPPIPVTTDCSGWVTLVYKQAGAMDPNRLGYSGEGYTATLLAQGVATQNPQPGDLAFWSGPDHVAIFGGNFNCYEFGGPFKGSGSGPGAPIETSLATEDGYHTSFLGFRSYMK